MKDIIKLIKMDVSILGFLLAMIVFAISDFGYIKEDFSNYKNYDVLESISESEMMNLCSGQEVFQGIDFTQAICDKFDNSSLYSIIVMFFILMMVVLCKKLLFFDHTRQEFQKTLPIKQVAWTIYDYLSGVIMIFVKVLMFAGLLLYYQTGLNKNIQEAAIQYGITNIDENMVALANERLMVYLMMYFIILILLYSYITFFVTLAKNAIAGIVLAGVCGGAVYGLFDMVFYDFYSELVLKNANVSPFWVTQRLQEYGCIQFDVTFWEATRFYIIIVILLVLGIYVAAKKRELSKGNIFCFPIMEFAFVLFVFMLVTVVLGELIDMFWLISMGLGLILGIFTYYMMTRPKKTSEVWEVK